MPLKLSLKPGEKLVLNGAVLTNGDKRASLIIQNKACLLRERDILQQLVAASNDGHTLQLRPRYQCACS